MAARGMFFGEGPMACPFVALESDRDRRSDEPDHRHRCYAEPDPAPRALAHQREYCLAAAFTACPIFQDWAIRAAATPVPLRPGRMQDTERDEQPRWAAPPPWVAPVDDEDRAAENAHADAPGSVSDAPAELEPAESSGDQRGFVAPPARPVTDVERVPSLDAERDAARATPAADADREQPEFPPRQPTPAEPGSDEPSAGDQDEVPLPAFLAGRADQYREPAGAAEPPSAEPARPEPEPGSRLPQETLRREDVVPAWGRKPVYGQTRSRVSLGDTGDVLSKITTMLAVGAILALAVVVIILAPSLLGFLDGGAPATTAPAGGLPSPTAAAPSPSPAVTPTPSPEPRTYTVQAGDTLFSIARRHGLTVEQLLAANPQVTNPNLVQIGQVLVIPEDDFGLFTPSPRPSPSP
jgi:LysM repeat protein